MYFSARVSLEWFVAAQFIYGVWNSVNDPLFGWLGDIDTAHCRRRSRILRGGLLWAAAFLLAWYAPAPHTTLAALHFLAVLVVYDTGLSYATVAHGALLADISPCPAMRAACSAAASVAMLCGAVGPLVANAAFDAANPGAFRACSAALAAVAAASFILAGRSPWLAEARTGGGWGGEEDEQPPRLLAVVGTLINRRELRSCAAAFFLQQLACCLATNFLSILLTLALGAEAAGLRAALLAATYVVPHAITLAVAPLIAAGRLTPISATQVFFTLRGVCCAAAVAALAAAPSAGLAAGCLTAARILTECACRLQPLVVAALSDADKHAHGRTASLAASIGGVLKLVTRPAESIAPLAGSFAIASMGGAAGASWSTTVPMALGISGALSLLSAGVWSRGMSAADVALRVPPLPV